MKGSHSEAIKEIRRKSKTFSDSKVKMFPDHVKVRSMSTPTGTSPWSWC